MFTVSRVASRNAMLHEWPAFDVSVDGSEVLTVLMIQDVAM